MRKKIKKLKKFLKRLSKSNKFLGYLIFILLNFYRKIKYLLRYIYRFDVDDGIILFDAGMEFDGKIKEIYERILYDEMYNGFQFIIATSHPKNTKTIIKDPSSVIIKRNTRKYLKYMAKAKYIYINNEICIYTKPKKEQVISLINEKFDYLELCDLGNKQKNYVVRASKKYIEKYADFRFTLNEYHKSKKINKKYICDKLGLDYSKKLIKVQVYFNSPNEYVLNDYLNEEFLNGIYDKLKNKYQIIFDFNVDIDTSIYEKYNNFYMNVSKIDGIYTDYISDIFLFNSYSIFDNKYVEYSNCAIFSNYERLFSQMTDGYIKLYKKFNSQNFIDIIENINDTNKYKIDDNYINCCIIDRKLCNNVVLCKQNKRHTYNMQIFKAKVVTPIKSLIVRFMGLFRIAGITITPSARKLKKYKNIHKGERCFLIGNGPSLTFDDLNSLKDEITIGCNLIYKIFDNTEWRPTYLCMADGLFLKNVKKELLANICCDIFAVKSVTKGLSSYDGEYNIVSLNSISLQKEGRYKVVSPLAYHYPGGTVMSMMISLAIYMGFKEIYLVGVDCTSSLAGGGHFIKGYMSSNMHRLDMKRIAKRLKKNTVTEQEVADYYFNRVMNVYNKFEDYSKKKKTFRIYNATRGGALEAFERKNLDEVIKNGR